MKIILFLLFPVFLSAQHSAGVFAGSFLAYNYDAATGAHTRQGAGYAFGVSTSDKKTDWLYFSTRFGGAYSDQPGYKSARLYAEITPEIRVYKGLFVGKPLYLAPTMWEKQGEQVRTTAMDMGHGVSVSYNFGAVRIETYYTRSINKVSDVGQVFARCYGARLHYYLKRK